MIMVCKHFWQMHVMVEDHTGASINLVVDSSISAIALAFLAGSELHLVLNKDLTLFEVINDIGIGKCKFIAFYIMNYYRV